VAEKLAGQAGNDPLQNAKVPSVDVYRYNFVSPAWSLDLAGMVVLTTGMIVLIIVIRTVMYWVLYLLLKQRHQW
jgi:hypothetical protein